MAFYKDDQLLPQKKSWYSGLLDMSQPTAMGLLAAGASMLQDSGYSAVPKTPGQILGNSLAAGVSGYTSTQDRLALQKQQALEQQKDRRRMAMDEFDFRERVNAARERRLQRSQLKAQLPQLISSLEGMEGLSPADQKQLRTARMLANSGAYDSALKALDAVKPQGKEIRVVRDRVIAYDPANQTVEELYQAPKERYQAYNTGAGLAVFDSENPDASRLVAGTGKDSGTSSGLLKGNSPEAQMYNIKIRSQLPPSDPRYLNPSDPMVRAADDYFSAQKTRGSFVDTETQQLPDGSTKQIQIRRFADGSSEVVGEKTISPISTTNRTKAIDQLRNLNDFEASLNALEQDLLAKGTESFGAGSTYQQALYNDASTKLRLMQQLGAPTGADLSLMAKSLSDPTEIFSMSAFGADRVLAQIKALREGIARDRVSLKNLVAGRVPGGAGSPADTLKLVAPNLTGRN